METAIIVDLPDGSQCLVRVRGVELTADQVKVDTRANSWHSWNPVRRGVEVRVSHEVPS